MKEVCKKILHCIDCFLMIFKKKNIIQTTVPVLPENELSGKVAFIAGGTGGIGIEVAKQLIKSGCKVIISGTSEMKIDLCIEKINSDNVKGIVINYQDIDCFEDYVNMVSSIWGQINFFINCVGTHTVKSDFFDITPLEYDRVMSINLKSTYFMCQKIAEYYIKNNIQGRICLISSSRGKEPAYSPYGLSKWGLNGFIKGLANTLAPWGIVVNGVAPGPTATSLIGYNEDESIYSNETMFNRLVTVQEVAPLVQYLISDLGAMICGEVVHISGGRGTSDLR